MSTADRHGAGGPPLVHSLSPPCSFGRVHRGGSPYVRGPALSLRLSRQHGEVPLRSAHIPVTRLAVPSRSRSARLLPLSLVATAVAMLMGGLTPTQAAAPGPPVDSTSPHVGQPLQGSNAEQLALSALLKSRGFIFYGAWWCPACFKQKNLFGQEAGNQLPYVECEKRPEEREHCQAVGIRAYPTWVLGTERREGVLTLEQLKRWSGFAGADRPAGAPTAGSAAAGSP